MDSEYKEFVSHRFDYIRDKLNSLKSEISDAIAKQDTVNSNKLINEYRMQISELNYIRDRTTCLFGEEYSKENYSLSKIL